MNNTSPSTLRINVGFLVNQPVGFNRDIHIEPEDVRLGQDLQVKNFQGVLHLSRTPQGLLAEGDFKASVELECGRCLNSFWMPLTSSFKELYFLKKLAGSEVELIIPGDLTINFSPLVREYFILETPINPICRSDCKGLCVTCGQDLNEIDCGHQLENAN